MQIQINRPNNHMMRCSECNKDFCTLGFYMKDYAYKIKSDKHIKYFCSYTCYNKYLDRKEKENK